ncbi:MAG TPA: OmpH family outer membrane protein [Treponemataceae bacterium]|nr:OmpH family outer membrane protein [Treponemataceae bacterium]
MKKNIVLFALLFIVGLGFAQEITRFGVVDTALVYSTFFRESSAVRSYESKKTGFQDEINTLTQDIQKLQEKKINYEKNDNKTQAIKIEAQIIQKTDFLNEYSRAKNIELESLRKNLEASDGFYEKLYRVISRIAETGGYSMILSLHHSDSILWYSPTVDVTNDVITGLSSIH